MKFMQNTLLGALLFAGLAPLHAESDTTTVKQTFSATGAEPTWSLKLIPNSDEGYQADFHVASDEPFSVPVTLMSSNRLLGGLQLYRGKTPAGETLSIITSATPCHLVTGEDYSHAVVVNADKLGTYEGCGGQPQGPDDTGGDIDNAASVASTASTEVASEADALSSPKKQPAESITPARKKAKVFNTRGYRLYKRGQYAKALPLFARAVETDNSYALAHYNLACTAAIGFEKFSCENEELFELADPKVVFKHLKQAIKYDPSRLTRSQTDPDLAGIRKSYRYYHELLGYSPSNDKQLKVMLRNVDWQSTGMRLYHSEPAVRLIFGAKGKLQIKTAHFIEGDIPKGSLPWRHKYKTGRYQVKDGVITVTINSNSVSGKLDEDGTLRFAGAEADGLLPTDVYRFVWDSPCEA